MKTREFPPSSKSWENSISLLFLSVSVAMEKSDAHPTPRTPSLAAISLSLSLPKDFPPPLPMWALEEYGRSRGCGRGRSATDVSRLAAVPT